MFFLLPFIAAAFEVAAGAATVAVATIPTVGATVAAGLTTVSTAVGTAASTAAISAGVTGATAASIGSIAASGTTLLGGEVVHQVAKELTD